MNQVRSKYIIAKIFDNLYPNKKLEIVRYNKNLKNKLKIRINAYKKAYSKMEIEIVPKENGYGRFIHIPKMKGEFNYHIYFIYILMIIKKKLIENI